MRTDHAEGPGPSRIAKPPPEAKVRPVRSATPTQVEKDSAAVPPELHFGILLRRARERRGLSLQDVARVTRISDRWIPALEEARLDLLPAPVFVKGYVRSYARTVGLDEDDLVDRYQALTQQRAQCTPTGQSGTAGPQAPDLRWLLLRVLPAVAALLVLALVIGLLVLRHR